jgi:thiamine-phosphate pyrophosphorylase
MANPADVRTRLVLVTPPLYEVAALASRLSDALSGGDVASLIITGDPITLQSKAEALVPIATARGVASLVLNDTRIASRSGADGVHIETGIGDIRGALDAFRRKKIVGAGNVTSRHDAMEIAEADPDYLFFGRLDGDTTDGIFPRALELASWWSEVAVVPAVVMGGRSLASVEEAAAAGIEFVALSSAVWGHAKGPAAAVASVAERLASVVEPAA